MRRFLPLASLTILFYINNICTKEFDAKNIGRIVSEAQVITGRKNPVEKMFGKNKSSKGLLALQAKDLAEAVRNARNKVRKEDEGNNDIYSTEAFVVAQVADNVITNIDIINAIRFVFFSSGRSYDKKYAKMMVKPVLDALIEDKMRQALARLNRVDINTEVQKRIEEIADNNQMSVIELCQTFKKAGIDILIFKKNIASKLVFSAFYQSLDLPPASTEEIKKEKEKYIYDSKHERYKLSEIFFKTENLKNQQTAKENADAIVELLNQGFKFSSLVENVSQADAISKTSSDEWKTADSLDEEVRNAIKTLKPGEHSAVIRVPNGYKIVEVIDKAMPNKEGLSKANFKVIVAEVPMHQPITEEEAISFQMIAKANSVEQFRRICTDYGLRHMETEITEPNQIQMELINRNKATGCSGIIRIAENLPLIALFIISESVPDAKIPSDKTLSDMIKTRAIACAFIKETKRQRITSYEHVYTDKLDEVIVD